MPRFHERLKKLRIAKGITQKEMARYLNVIEQAYQRYEYGKREPKYDVAIIIADFFDVSLDYLMGRTDSPARVYNSTITEEQSKSATPDPYPQTPESPIEEL